MANSLDLVLCHPSLRYKGGAERMVLEIAKKYNPVIYTADGGVEEGYPEFREFDVRQIPRHFAENLVFFSRNNGRVRISAKAGFRYFSFRIMHEYDVINSHVVPSEWIRNRNERVCWYCHSPVRAAFDLRSYQMSELDLPGRIAMEGILAAYKFGEFSVLRKIERICTNSEVSKRRIRQYLGRGDAEIVSPGVDCKSFSCRSYDRFFFCPSRIVPEKRFERAIEAFRMFNKKKWKLVIAGALSDSRRDQEYFKRLRHAAAGSDVEFRTNISDSELQGLYSNCYATLFAAMEEDFGIVPLEAMASSKPCISVNEGGPRETITDGKTGFLVNSAEEMAGKMKFLAEHPDECEKIGKAGRKHVLQNYTWKIFLEKMDKALRETARA